MCGPPQFCFFFLVALSIANWPRTTNILCIQFPCCSLCMQFSLLFLDMSFSNLLIYRVKLCQEFEMLKDINTIFFKTKIEDNEKITICLLLEWKHNLKTIECIEQAPPWDVPIFFDNKILSLKTCNFREKFKFEGYILSQIKNMQN